jgi:hypothetical protein
MNQPAVPQQNAERAMESISFGLNWAREFADHTLDQSKVAWDALLKASDKMAKDFESQSSVIREHTTAFAAKALSNSVDFGHKCLSAKHPDELVRLQTEFVSQQAQILAERAREIGQQFQSATQASYDTLSDAARRTEQSIAQSVKRPR